MCIRDSLHSSLLLFYPLHPVGYWLLFCSLSLAYPPVRTSRDFLSPFIRNSSSTPYLSFSVKYYLTSNICLSLYQDQIDFLLSWPNPNNSNHTPLLSFKGCRSPPLLIVTIQVASLVHTISAPVRFHHLIVAITASFPKHQPNSGHTASGLVLSAPQRTGWAALSTSLEKVGILSTPGNAGMLIFILKCKWVEPHC